MHFCMCLSLLLTVPVMRCNDPHCAGQTVQAKLRVVLLSIVTALQVIMLFQKQDGVDVCLYCLYMQEYGDELPCRPTGNGSTSATWTPSNTSGVHAASPSAFHITCCLNQVLTHPCRPCACPEVYEVSLADYAGVKHVQ